MFANLMTHKQFRFNLRAQMLFADTLISVKRLTFHSKIPRMKFLGEIDHAKNQIKMELKKSDLRKYFEFFNLFIRHTSKNARINSPTDSQPFYRNLHKKSFFV